MGEAKRRKSAGFNPKSFEVELLSEDSDFWDEAQRSLDLLSEHGRNQEWKVFFSCRSGGIHIVGCALPVIDKWNQFNSYLIGFPASDNASDDLATWLNLHKPAIQKQLNQKILDSTRSMAILVQ